ncbi:Efflux pump roqT [Penicillium rolfsii]|nr:Efflux pump roqT [Penicillium rolfsii]
MADEIALAEMVGRIPRESKTDLDPQSRADGPCESPQNYPRGYQFALISASLMLSVFLTGLDATIITTAVPKITDEFHSIADVGWYGSAFRLASSISQLVQGRVFDHFSVKWAFLLHLLVFEAGALLSGAAPSSAVFIIGRAISGLGFSGISQGCMVIISMTRPLDKRPVYIGAISGSEFFATAIAPIIGGAITSSLSWRWCFYLNVIVSIIPALITLLVLKTPSGRTAHGVGHIKRLQQIDFVGMALFAAALLSLLLSIQWGGDTYSWSNDRIIALLTLSPIFFIIFLLVQAKKRDFAMLPLRLLKQRSILFGALFSLASQAINNIASYYLSMWFQVVKGASPVESGIMLLPMVIALLIASVLSGFAITYIGYYVVLMVPAGLITLGGAIMMIYFEETTPKNFWIPALALLGFGIGLGLSGPFLAVQAILPERDMSVGLAIMSFSQEFGIALSLGVAQCLFLNELRASVKLMTPNLNPESVINAGATSLAEAGLEEYASLNASEYSQGLKVTFDLGLGMAAVGVVTSCFMEIRSVK